MTNMVESREQRLQMRQRGAATRKTKEVDFGLSFTTPSVPSTTKTPAGLRRIPRKTPRRSLAQPKSTRKSLITSSTRRSNTPSVVNGESSERRGVFDIPIDENHEQEPRVGSLEGGHKWRRLSKREQNPDPLPASTPSDKASSSLNSLIERNLAQNAGASPTPAPDSRFSDGDKGNATIGSPKGGARANSPSKKLQLQSRKRRKRRSIGQQRPKRRSLGSVQEELETRESPQAATPQEASDTSPIKKKTRKKRKSIGQQRPKRRALEPVSESVLEPVLKSAETGDLPQATTEAEAPQSRSPPAERKARKKRKSIGQQRLKRHSSQSARRRQDIDAPESSADVENRTRHPSSLAHVKAGPSLLKQRRNSPRTVLLEPKASRKRRRDSDDASDDIGSDQSQRAPPDSIPIIVYRLSRPAALLQNDHNNEDELHHRREKFPKRAGVNAADVLSQIWRETTKQAVDTLKEKCQKEGRKAHQEELKRKWNVVSSFGKELEDLLFDLSESLDYNFSLSTRLRRANKEKVALREEFLKIGQEREDIAQKTDEVRLKYEESSKIAEEHDELNNSLHDLDLALERERRDQTQGGFEFLLRTVTNDVSSLSDNGGLLNQVKDFNALLEKSATALEARAEG